VRTEPISAIARRKDALPGPSDFPTSPRRRRVRTLRGRPCPRRGAAAAPAPAFLLAGPSRRCATPRPSNASRRQGEDLPRQSSSAGGFHGVAPPTPRISSEAAASSVTMTDCASRDECPPPSSERPPRSPACVVGRESMPREAEAAAKHCTRPGEHILSGPAAPRPRSGACTAELRLILSAATWWRR